MIESDSGERPFSNRPGIFKPMSQQNTKVSLHITFPNE